MNKLKPKTLPKVSLKSPKAVKTKLLKSLTKLTKTEKDVKELKDLSKTKYQGWSNWQTWATALWLNNERWAYEQLNELVKHKKFNKNNRKAVSLARWAAKKENYKSPEAQRAFVLTTNFKEIAASHEVY